MVVLAHSVEVFVGNLVLIITNCSANVSPPIDESKLPFKNKFNSSRKYLLKLKLGQLCSKFLIKKAVDAHYGLSVLTKDLEVERMTYCFIK